MLYQNEGSGRELAGYIQVSRNNEKPVEPADYARLKPYFQGQRHPLCVYSLDVITVWSNHLVQPVAAEVDGMLAVAARYARSPEKDHLLLPLAPGGADCPPDTLRRLADSFAVGQFWFVPEDYISRHRQNGLESLFSVAPQPELADYIYLAEDLAELKGNRFHDKRNLCRQFEKNYILPGRAGAEPVTPENQEECAEFLDEWCAERDCASRENDDLNCEHQACLNALENIASLGMSGLAVRVDGKITAFGIASQVTGDMGALHFEKATSRIKGLYQYLDRECARRLFKGMTFINKESDMGLPGLAQAKRSYNPVRIELAYCLAAR
jgi:hypothetical protein